MFNRCRDFSLATIVVCMVSLSSAPPLAAEPNAAGGWNSPLSFGPVHIQGRDAYNPSLDEALEIPDFTVVPPIDGGTPQVLTVPGGVAGQGEVIGFSFQGDVVGPSGSGTWASDLCMIVQAPDGTTFGVGGASATEPGCSDNDWDFQGIGSADDGFYESEHLDAFDPPVADAGDWTFTFVNDLTSSAVSDMDWSNVVVTLHKIGDTPPPPPINPALDEALDIPDFTAVPPIAGGTPQVLTVPGGVASQGEVVGFSFQGDVVGPSGSGTWASDLCMIVQAPDGTTFGVGGASATEPGCMDNDWDFQGIGSIDDGFYESEHLDAFNPPVGDAGDWTFTFVNDFTSSSASDMDWSNVVVTLHKTGDTPPPSACENVESVIGTWETDAGWCGNFDSTATSVTYESARLTFDEIPLVADIADFGYTYEVDLIINRPNQPTAASGILVNGDSSSTLGPARIWDQAIAFAITADGRYSIFRFNSGSVQALQPWTNTAAGITNGPGEPNTLSVVSTVTQLVFSINGEVVRTLDNPTLAGEFGVGFVRSIPTGQPDDDDWMSIEDIRLQDGFPVGWSGARSLDQLVSPAQHRLNREAQLLGSRDDAWFATRPASRAPGGH